MKERMLRALLNCCYAHRVGCEWRWGPAFVVHACNVPLLNDVGMIVEGFTGSRKAILSGSDRIAIDMERAECLPEPDVELIKMALPYGTEV